LAKLGFHTADKRGYRPKPDKQRKREEKRLKKQELKHLQAAGIRGEDGKTP
jgi:hypothetical protein